MSQTKVKSGLLNFPDQTDFVKLPSGTTAQRPSSPEKGYSRYNTTDNKLEFWNGTVWQQLPGVVPPTITSVSYPGDDLAADPDGGQTITLTGTNFLNGASIEIDGTTASVVTVVSGTEITFTAPAKAAGDYDIVLTNGDNTTATYVDGMAYNGLPSWTTPAGNLGAFEENKTIPTITLVAAEPDSGAISYSITTGGLPTGLTLTGADIDGTTPAVAGETTYNFTVTATDNENQSTERAFNIVVYKFVPYFNTVTWTGDSSTNRQITGVGFEPGLVWIKNRDRASSNLLFDSVRGGAKALISNETLAEQTYTDTLVSFDSDGFTINQSSAVNQSGEKIVAWCWKAGETIASGQGTGGITNVSYSVNVDAGFSIITYNGNNSAGTLTHGLSSTPELIIAKRRTAASGWDVCGNFGGLQYGTNRLRLEDTSAITTDTNEIIGADSTTISVSTSSVVNQGDVVMYAFHSVIGYSKFGGFTGTGTTAGEVITTGFEPAFVIWKKASVDASSHWNIVDNKRSLSNGRRNVLYSNLSSAEDFTSYDIIDFNANGFQVKAPYSQFNESGQSFIYMAFANQF